MKKAIQYGAGNIGRGFIGKILNQSGYHVIFADINKEVINKLNIEKKYIVETLGIEKKEEIIENVDGVLSDSFKMLDFINDVELITTAVGPNVLKFIAPVIANGIKVRFKQNNINFLNIIACENFVNASTFLKQEVIKHLNSDEVLFLEKYIGFPNSAVDRIVPPFVNSDITKVAVEEFSEWIVEKPLFKGQVPNIKGMELVDNLLPFVERKLFTLNTGHVFCAYFGYLKGYKTIKESIDDIEIKKMVKQAMEESGAVLIKKYNLDPIAHQKYIDKIIIRFENPYLKDDIARVAREPIRKLGYDDRLIKPAREAQEFGFKNDALIYAIACTFLYKDPNDQQANLLNQKIEQLGIEKTIYEITNLTSKKLVEKIEETYLSIKNKIQRKTID